MKKLIIAAGLLMTTSAYAQTEVLTGVTRGKDYGVVYSLPKTQIELEIKANKVKYTPGEFSKYADRYFYRSRSVLGTGKRKSEIRRSAQWRRYLLCEIER